MIYIEKTNDMFMEEAMTFFESANAHIMLDFLYPKVNATLSTPQGDRKFRQLVGRYMDRNSEKLHTPGPMYLIPFGDLDKAEFFELFQINPKEIVKVVNEITTSLSTTSDFKLLRGNPIFWLFYCCIRFYHLKRDQKGINTALSIYALSVYPSVFSIFFPHGVNEGVMQYTVDNLTEKFMMKKEEHLFGALFKSIQNSYDFLKGYLSDASDKEMIRFIQRIRNDQKSMIRKICDRYMENYRKGLRVTLTKDNYGEFPIDDEATNNTSDVEMVTKKVVLPILTNGVDLSRASACAKLSQVGVSDCRYYLSRILVDKNGDDIEKFIQSILFLFLYDEKKTPLEINSRYFLSWSLDLYRKTNSNNDNIACIKESLDKWAEESGVHAKFKREASRVNYKKAIFLYFILSIQSYNQ